MCVTKMLINNWGLKEYLKLDLHYKIKLRSNYRATLDRRTKKNRSNNENNQKPNSSRNDLRG